MVRRGGTAGAMPGWLGLCALVGFVACGRPTRVNWSVCTPSETTCLTGYTCDTTTWQCVPVGDGGTADARDSAVASDSAVDSPDAPLGDAAEGDEKPADGGADAAGDVDVDLGCRGPSDCPMPGLPVCEPVTRRCVACVAAADCTGSGKACDLATHTCVSCVSSSDCTGSPTGAKVCDTAVHTCVGCLASSDCAGSRTGAKVCDTAVHACVGCLASSDCAGSPTGAKVCDTSVHSCVGCLASTDCGGNTKVCDPGTHACVACLGSTDCAAPAPVCDTTARSCVGCLMDNQCGDKKPFCDAASKTCVPCGNDASCAAKGATSPACAVVGEKAGACVACTDSKKHCPQPGTPICDSATYACRACAKDAECAAAYGPNPGLCVEGRCLGDADVLYVQSGTTCASADGSVAKPFCSLSDAMSFISAERHVFVVRGPGAVGGSPVPFSAAKALVAGQGGASISGPTTSALVSLSSGELTLRDLTISGATEGAGVSATGGVLRILRARIVGNAESGIVARNAAFDIQNTIVAGNGGSNNPGINLGALPSGVTSPATFLNNTVVGNGLIGVACGGAFTLANSIISANGTAQVSAGCIFADVCATTCSSSPTLDPTSYHLTAASTACLDKAAGAAPADDVDGDARPANAAADCGADEYTGH